MKEQEPTFDDIVKELLSAPQDPQFLIKMEEARAKEAKELADYFGLSNLTPEQQERADCALRIEASEALEGYRPLREEGGYAFELQKKWILGEITTEEEVAILKKYDWAQ